jgi:hypothetical protein
VSTPTPEESCGRLKRRTRQPRLSRRRIDLERFDAFARKFAEFAASSDNQPARSGF